MQTQVEKSSLPLRLRGPHLLIFSTSIPLRVSTTRSALPASLARLTPCSVSPGWLAPAGAAAISTAAAAATVASEIEIRSLRILKT